jgi:hypothetical protein
MAHSCIVYGIYVYVYVYVYVDVDVDVDVDATQKSWAHPTAGRQGTPAHL